MSGGAPLPQPTTEKVLSVDDLQAAADKTLTSSAREFFNSGSTDQRTLQANRDALAQYFLRSRVLVPVRDLNTETSVFGGSEGDAGGVRVKFPLGCAPAGIQGMAHPDGELATSRAAAKWGVNQAISSFASYSIDEIVSAGGEVQKPASTTKNAIGSASRLGGAYIIQMYPMRDRTLQSQIIRNAESAGCHAIFLTGDSPVLGVRYNEWRNDFRTPEGIGFPIMNRSTKQIRETTHDSGFQSFNDDNASWESEIAWLKERTRTKVFVKGVMCAEDVREAAKWGADGVVVSNHGGRQLDGVPGTMDVLEECVDAARGTEVEVHVDGGLRRGSDVFVALALGARCAWVGRAVLWGLAYKGQEGVERMLEIFYEDFRRTMALTGCKTVADINRSCLSRIGRDGRLRRLADKEGTTKL